MGDRGKDRETGKKENREEEKKDSATNSQASTFLCLLYSFLIPGFPLYLQGYSPMLDSSSKFWSPLICWEGRGSWEMSGCLMNNGQGQTLGSSWRHVATTGSTQGEVWGVPTKQ